MHGDIAATEVYQVYILLREISPAIWRRVWVRTDSTIADLHYALQLVMGWTDSHLNRLRLRGKDYDIPRATGRGIQKAPSLSDFRLRHKQK